ncbi:MAG: flagellar biosynthetic protein FliR [Bacteroidetes bacterium]|nr:flagellar biosynthetic protein FliR [Bacteroidota bacterium]MCH8523818.1 flagellar biosynthetic protein FliR [Balneolales bacterium]
MESIDFIVGAFFIFVRVGAMIMTAPFFNVAVFPTRVKLFFAAITSILLFPVIPAESVAPVMNQGALFLLTIMVSEILTGVAMGLVGQLIFAGIEMGGQLIAVQAALSFANIVDTTSEIQNTVVSNFYTTLAVLFFLTIGGDYMYLQALVYSFHVIPISGAELHLTTPYFLQIAVYLFMIGVQLSAPFLIVLFLLNLSFAIFARIMPQANIFFIALPVKMGIAIILLHMVMPYLPVAFDGMFTRMFDFLSTIIDVMGGRL